VQDAVESLPQLSLLNANTRSIALLANTLRDPAFVGTLFAPTDQVRGWSRRPAACREPLDSASVPWPCLTSQLTVSSC
jgi:hypothetical protein